MKPDQIFRKFGPPPPMRPPTIAVDRMGRPIEPGHLILMNDPNGFVFEVVAVTPVLNPAMPPGQAAVQVMVRAEFPIHVQAGAIQRGLIVVGETKARKELLAQGNGAPEAEGPKLVLTDPDAEPDTEESAE
jgi:hypothetical protein